MGCSSSEVTLQNRCAAVIGVVAGKPGIQGLPGSAAQRYHYADHLMSAASTWTINHNLGYTPTAVNVYTPGGVEVEAHVTNTSINQTVITFNIPFAGTADLI